MSHGSRRLSSASDLCTESQVAQAEAVRANEVRRDVEVPPQPSRPRERGIGLRASNPRNPMESYGSLLGGDYPHAHSARLDDRMTQPSRQRGPTARSSRE